MAHYMEQVFLLSLVIFEVVSAMILLDGSERIKDDSSNDNKYKVCNTMDCLRTGELFKEFIDPSVQPCEDFHKYSCGNFKENSTHFDQLNIESVFKINSILEQDISSNELWSNKQVKLFYQSCLKADSRANLKSAQFNNFLKNLKLARLPYLTESRESGGNNRRDGIMEMVGSVARILGIDILFSVTAEPDPQQTSKFIIALHPQRKKLFSDQSYYEIINGKNFSDKFSNLDQTAFESTFQKADELNTKIINSTSKVSSFQDLDNEIIMTLEELQNTTDQYVIAHGINSKLIWKSFFSAYFQNSTISDSLKKIAVLDIMYFKKVALILSLTDDSTLEALIWWKSFAYYATEISSQVFDPDAFTYSFITCTVRTIESFGPIVSKMMIEAFYKNENYQSIAESFETLKATFIKKFQQADWLDKETKFHSIEKLRKMRKFIGFPKGLVDKTEDVFYPLTRNLNMTADNFLDNILQISDMKSISHEIHRFETIVKQLNSSHLEVDEWLLNSFDMNAVYVSIINGLIIPAGIMQFPMYHLGLKFLNYGAIGTIIAHELGHGFDYTGRKYNDVGNEVPTWTDSSNVLYEEKAKCFVHQYNETQLKPGKYIDGFLTLDENIADHVGLDLAYEAYQSSVANITSEWRLMNFEHFNPNQLFFLSFAQMWCDNRQYETLADEELNEKHTPNRFRVNNVLQNSEAFSKTWNCPIGSVMNPKKKCKLF